MPSYSLDRTKLLAAGGSETFGAGSLKILYFKVKSFPESGLKIYQHKQNGIIFTKRQFHSFQTTGQMMSSVRLYLLPEYTTDGRQHYHGEVSSVYIFVNRKMLELLRVV